MRRVKRAGEAMKGKRRETSTTTISEPTPREMSGASLTQFTVERERARRIASITLPAKKRAQRVEEDDFSFLPTCSYDIEATDLHADGGFMLCAGVKPWGRPTKVFRIDRTPGYRKAMWDDSQVTKELCEELNKYRICIAWNGDNYDVRFINTRLMLWGMKPLSSDTMFVDPIWVARRRMRLHSNSLASVLAAFKIPIKKTLVDLEVWKMAKYGHKPSMEYIVDHNIKDCDALEALVKRISALMPFKYGYIR